MQSLITEEIVSLEGLGEDARGLVIRLLSDLECGGNSADVVSIHDRCMPAEALGALLVQLYSENTVLI